MPQKIKKNISRKHRDPKRLQESFERLGKILGKQPPIFSQAKVVGDLLKLKQGASAPDES